MISVCERKRYVLSIPVQLKAEDLLSFIHHPIFTQDWKDLRLDDDDLNELELCLMLAPRGHENVISGGEVRLIKVLPERRPGRIPVRVVVGYAIFEERSIVALLAAEAAAGSAEITDEDRCRLRCLADEIRDDI